VVNEEEIRHLATVTRAKLSDAIVEMDAADAALVQQEGFDKVDVLAWCKWPFACDRTYREDSR
jgi:hypothetical protein